MTKNPVLFYVSLDNSFCCSYSITKTNLECQIITSSDNIELCDYLDETDICLTSPVKHVLKGTFGGNHDQIIKGALIEQGDKEHISSILDTATEPTKSSVSQPVNLLCMPIPILFIKPFVKELEESRCYRKGVYKKLNKLLKQHIKVLKLSSDTRLVLQVFSKDSYRIDFAWDYRLGKQIRLAIERECASAWLSTLGGGFSALGEQSDRCAKMALKISLQQIQLSIDSQDMDGVARGWLFLALALSQLGHSKAAFRLLNMANNTHSYDDKHVTMCMGVEVKLKYDRQVRKQHKDQEIIESPAALQKLIKSVL